jgi:cytoskeleton protein RodZ
MSETHDEVVVTQSTPTLGERLKEAREAKKYSIAEVAAQLRLTKEIVICLESQDWEQLNGRTYARGYFASYVKFLGLPSDEMLALFNLEYTATEPAINLKPHNEIRDERRFPWFMMGLIAIVLLVLWLAYQQWQNTQTALQDDAMTSEARDAAEEDSFADSIVEPLDDAPGNSVETPVMPLETTEQPALEITEERLAELNASESGNIDESALPLENVQQAVSAPVLKMTFSDECWVKVTDADDRVIVSQVMQADQELELPVDKALNVSLGRADVVMVYYNNEPVDLTPHTRGDVARLTLGGDS